MDQSFTLDSLVELQDQYSAVYPLSPTGARGWVRARREYPKSDPEVYIEWDKAHWRYHGEKDGWTFAHHFRAVNDADIHGLPEDQILSDINPADGVCPNCGEVHEEEEVEGLEDQFLHTLLAAQEEALDAEGYFIVTLAPRLAGDHVIYEPKIYADALTETAREMIEAQLVQIAAQLFDHFMVERMNDLGDTDEP